MSELRPQFLAACVTIIQLVLSTPVLAEPSPLVSKLMAEPVTLFSYGMDQLGQRASEAAKRSGLISGSASYDWGRNEISIAGFAFGESPAARCASSADCQRNTREALEKFAASFAVKTGNGWEQYVTGLFTHTGFGRDKFLGGKSLEDAIADLPRIVKLRVWVLSTTGRIECQRQLQSTEIFCSQSEK